MYCPSADICLKCDSKDSTKYQPPHAPYGAAAVAVVAVAAAQPWVSLPSVSLALSSWHPRYEVRYSGSSSNPSVGSQLSLRSWTGRIGWRVRAFSQPATFPIYLHLSRHATSLPLLPSVPHPDAPQAVVADLRLEELQRQAEARRQAAILRALQNSYGPADWLLDVARSCAALLLKGCYR